MMRKSLNYILSGLGRNTTWVAVNNRGATDNVVKLVRRNVLMVVGNNGIGNTKDVIIEDLSGKT